MSADTPAEATTTSPIPKYSRYRSVRKAAAAETPASPPPAKEVAPKEDAIARSMSRYRKSRVAPKMDTMVASPPVPALPQMPRQMHSQSVTASSRPVHLTREPQRRATDPVTPSPGLQTGARGRAQDVTAGSARNSPKVASPVIRSPQLGVGETTEIGEEAAEQLLAEQKKKDLQRLEAELAAATSTQKALSPREKLGFFSRKRGTVKTTAQASTGSGNESSSPTTLTKPRQRIDISNIGPPQPIDPHQILSPVLPEVKEEQPKVPEPPRIEVTNANGQSAGRAAPQIDAPISASNAPDRRVLIRCKQSSINLPVTPETTALDLIYSAANIMTQDISISHSILLESYTHLGLERRLRRYEHVRDIMNSWDRDAQNALVIQKSDSPQCDHDLDASHAPKRAPVDLTVQMYHSQKPGKWNKRYITLLSMGQIFVSKKPDSKVSDKDVVNICHLSDFDIYTPTAQQVRKVLKPPKKHCYAIKSQQKTNMFLSTENFVHFFCTDDETLAQKWYDTVQQWRSWYLVNRMGEGTATSRTTKRVISDSSSGSRHGHSVRVSVDASPYTIGSFQPLINMDRFGSQSNDDSVDSDEDNRPRQIPFHLRNGVASPPREARRYPPVVNYKVPPEQEEEFSSGGLLGRTYTMRQRALKDKEKEKDALPDGPFVEGPSLLNRGSLKGLGHSRSLSVKSTKEKRPETSGGGLQRSGSQRQKPKPLLDFTPTFKEAPQWDKSRHGHGVKPIEGLPLVEAATGPDEKVGTGLGLPDMTLLRRDQVPNSTGMARPTKDHQEGAFIKGGLVGNM